MTAPVLEGAEELIFKWCPESIIPENRAAYRLAVEAEFVLFLEYAKNSRRTQSARYARITRYVDPLSPLDYWKSYCDEWPHLKALAVRVFSLAATSASCERNFSLMGFIHSKLRNRLSAIKVQMIAFLMGNYKQLKNVKHKVSYKPKPVNTRETSSGAVEIVDVSEGDESDDESLPQSDSELLDEAETAE